MDNEKKVLLWLDDTRNPHSGGWLNQWAPEFMYDGRVVWVKDYNEFTSWIEQYGLPTKIAFDHDLADEHYRPSMYDEDEHYSEYYDNGTFTEKTGYDAARWLVQYCGHNELKFPDYIIQSANPIGRKNIRTYIENGKKHLDI